MPFVPSAGPSLPTTDPTYGGRGVIYSPGNPSPGPNEYTSWADAYAAAAEPRSIYVDDSFVSPVPIPSGSWEVNELRAAAAPGAIALVEPQAGCVLVNLATLDHITMDGVSPSPVIPLASGQMLNLKWSSINVQSTGAPAVSVSAFSYITAEFSQIGNFAGVAVDVNGFLLLFVDSGSGVANTALDSSAATGICVAQLMNAGAYVNPVQGPGLLLLLSNYGQGSNVGYTPAVLADWSGVAPANLADALDRIAAALGPIA
jgi:hypothetical protein